MSEDLNSINLVGRLTRDADLQYTKTGYPVLKMSIAVNRRKKQGDQWVNEASFFDINLFGKRGESLCQYLTKGNQIAITGELRQERWQQDGINRSKVVIEAGNIQLLGGRPEMRQDGYSRPPESSGKFEDDIPY